VWALTPTSSALFSDGFDKWGAMLWSAALGRDE